MVWQDVELPSVDPTDCESKYSDEVLVNVIKRHHHWLTKVSVTEHRLVCHYKYAVYTLLWLSSKLLASHLQATLADCCGIFSIFGTCF